jgi:hypothetical protein
MIAKLLATTILKSETTIRFGEISMHLQAHAASCFSSTFVLKLNDRAFGKVDGRWFSESLDIQLLERRHLVFRKLNWLSSQFELADADTDEVFGSARRSGVFTSSWDLHLSIGKATLVRAGWLGTRYEIREDGARALAEHRGCCSRDWYVEASDDLNELDILLIGLVYQVVQRRMAQQSNAAASGS